MRSGVRGWGELRGLMGCVVSRISGEFKNVMGQSIWDVTDVFCEGRRT